MRRFVRGVRRKPGLHGQQPQQLGAASWIGSRSDPVLLGSRLSQSRESNTFTNGAKPSVATSSAERATSETALKFAPRPGIAEAKVQSGSPEASFAAAACALIWSIVAAAACGLLLATLSLSSGISWAVASSSSLIDGGLRPQPGSCGHGEHQQTHYPRRSHQHPPARPISCASAAAQF